MPNPIITPPRVPLVDPRTGMIDRAWYLFLVSLKDVATNTVNATDSLGPDSGSLISSVTSAIQALAQDVSTQPVPVDMSAELINQIEAVNLVNCCNSLISQVAEMQKQIDALALLPAQVTAMLSQLADVGAMSPADGDKLIYNGTVGKWQQDSRSYLMLE
jgi:hypothetical protein